MEPNDNKDVAMNADIHILDSEADAIRVAVRDWEATLRGGARVLGLATGGTMVPFYREWARRMRGDPLIAALTTFNLDEYYGIGQDHPGTFRRFMDTHCFGPLGIGPAQVRFLPAEPVPAVDAVCRAYEEAIEACGGLDVCLLGIGPNGHLAFNEPGTAFESRTHLAALTDETREANRPGFPGGRVPERALTMGLATVMQARQLVLLAFGAGKAEPVARALRGPVDPSLPASVVQRHPHVRVYLDHGAASGL
jgi:glucosamine-6-phosphate deaminase